MIHALNKAVPVNENARQVEQGRVVRVPLEQIQAAGDSGVLQREQHRGPQTPPGRCER